MHRYFVFVALLLTLNLALGEPGDKALPQHLLKAIRPAVPYDGEWMMRKLLSQGEVGGVVDLEIDYASGAVREVQIRQTTGSPILDQVMINCLSRWQFEPNTTSHAEVPVCWTSSGVFYR